MDTITIISKHVYRFFDPSIPVEDRGSLGRAAYVQTKADPYAMQQVPSWAVQTNTWTNGVKEEGIIPVQQAIQVPVAAPARKKKAVVESE